MKHTPGRWLIDRQTVYALNDEGVNRFSASMQAGWNDMQMRTDADELAANARLVAAAPDLYDAADFALNVLIGCCIPAGGVDDRKAMLEAQAKLRDAIRKATGESA